MTIPPTPPEALLSAALRLLAPRRRGVDELRGRLRKKGFEAREVASCLAWLEERGLLDDRAFSEALVRDRMRFSPRSPASLKRELASKGIASPLVEEAVTGVLEEEGVSEKHLAREAGRGWARKQGRAALEALLADRFTQERERARRRLYGFLSRRGFRGGPANEGIDAGEDEARKILSADN